MKKNRIFQHEYQRQVKMYIYLYLSYDWFDDDNRVVHAVWRHLTDENSI